MPKLNSSQLIKSSYIVNLSYKKQPTYAAETRADTVKTQQILETVEMIILQRITENTLKDHRRSEYIMDQCAIPKMGDWVKNYISRIQHFRQVKVTRNNVPHQETVVQADQGKDGNKTGIKQTLWLI